MLLYFFLIFSLYYIFILLMTYGWNKLSISLTHRSPKDFPQVSIIIAVRNEEKNILKLLHGFSQQSFPINKYELIIVDDDSSDNTMHKIQKFIISNKVNIKLLKSEFQPGCGKTPKKVALQKGIEASKGEIIVMTDGDCWFGEEWLESMTTNFVNEKIMFVAGPVALNGNESLLSKIQVLEFSSLIGSGGALIGFNYPIMCNGANLAFRKKAFYEVNGYDGFEDTSSGDDVFLMQKIHASFKNSIAFQKDPRALVHSSPQRTVSDLINQRKRWASKWNKFILPLSWVLPIFLLIHYVSFIACIIIFFVNPQNSWIAGLLLLTKIILDYGFLKKVMDFCNLRFEFWVFLLSEFLYPFYAITIGISVHFGNYKWKDRFHKN